MINEHHPRLHYHSFKNALAGIADAAQTQRNFRLELAIAALALVGAYLLEFSPVQLTLIVSLIFLVLSFEMLNTSIEAMVDSVHVEDNQWAKVSKDAAAAAVLLVSLLALVAGVYLYIPAILFKFF